MTVDYKEGGGGVVVPSYLTPVTPCTVAHQAPLSMEFSRQEYWSGLPFPSPGDLPDPGIKPKVLISPSLTGGFFISSATWEALYFLEPSPNIASAHS